jgi:hypothetical protein
MLGHDKVSCAALKISSPPIVSPSTSSRRSVSPPTEEEFDVGIYILIIVFAILMLD